MNDRSLTRNKFILAGTSFLVSGFTIPTLANVKEDRALIAHEMKVMGDMATGNYDFLWKMLGGITEEELDWRPNKESNPVRWVLGHLCCSRNILPIPWTDKRVGT
jgi:hypothetical protein